MQSSKSSVAPLSTGTLNDASHITLTNLVLSPISQGKMEANFGELVSFQTVASTAANVQNNNTSSNGNDVSSVVNPVFIGFPALFASHRLKSESHIPNQENKSSQLNKERRPSTSGREEAARPSYTNRRASVDKSKKKENKNDKNDNSEGQTEQMLLHQHSSDAFYNNRRKRSLSCNDLLAVHTAAHNFSQKGNHNSNEEDNSGSSNSNPNNNNNNKIVASSFSGSLYSFSSSAANPNPNNNNNPHFSDVNTLRQNFVFSDLQHFQMKSNSDSNSTQGSGAAGYRPQREDDEEQVRTSDTVEGGTLRIQPSAAPPLVSSPIFKPVRKDESLNSAVHHNSNGNNIDYDNRLASLDENWFRRRTMRPEDISENKKKSSSNESNNTTNKSENYDAIFQSIKTDTLYSAVRTSDQHNNSGSHQHAIKDEADNDVMVLESDAEEENPKDNNNNNNNVKVVKKTRSRRKSVVSIVERHVGDTNENNTNKATEKNNNNNGHNKSHNNSVNTSKEEEGMLSLRSSQIFKSILQSTNNNNNNIHPPNNNNNTVLSDDDVCAFSSRSNSGFTIEEKEDYYKQQRNSVAGMHNTNNNSNMSNNTANTNTNNSSKPTSNNNETGYVKRRRRDSVSLHHKVTSPDETRGKDLSEAERVTGENEAMADIKILLDFMEEEAHKEGGGEGGAPAGGNSPVPLVDTSDSPFSPPGPRRRRETRKPTL